MKSKLIARGMCIGDIPEICKLKAVDRSLCERKRYKFKWAVGQYCSDEIEVVKLVPRILTSVE